MVQSTARAGPPHACSHWTLSSGHGSCSGSGWLAILPGDGTQSSPAPEFVPATFGQPPAEFLGVVLVAWHDGARGQDSQLVLQHVEVRDGVAKAVHEQHVVLVGSQPEGRQHCRLIRGGASGGP